VTSDGKVKPSRTVLPRTDTTVTSTFSLSITDWPDFLVK
jgi:hypothetical protein